VAGEALPRFSVSLAPFLDKKRRDTNLAAASLPWASPRSLYLTPVNHNREWVGSDTGSAHFWPTEARRLRTAHSGVCS
jgi:hypothetical protein